MPASLIRGPAARLLDEEEWIAGREVDDLEPGADEPDVVVELAGRRGRDRDVVPQDPQDLRDSSGGRASPDEVGPARLPVRRLELLAERAPGGNQPGDRRTGVIIDSGDGQGVVGARLAEHVAGLQLHDQVECPGPGRSGVGGVVFGDTPGRRGGDPGDPRVVRVHEAPSLTRRVSRSAGPFATDRAAPCRPRYVRPPGSEAGDMSLTPELCPRVTGGVDGWSGARVTGDGEAGCVEPERGGHAPGGDSAPLSGASAIWRRRRP